jgi:hypothetical protein
MIERDLMKQNHKSIIISVAVSMIPAVSFCQDSTAELAKKLANPVAALVSVPVQFNYDENIGADDGGSAWKINLQPVIPFSMNEDWNIISRTILPIIDQHDIPSDGKGDSGIGDVLQTLFFSPKEPTAGGWILGVGPVALLPTASHDNLGGEKWGIGPTFLALKQTGPWTFGALINHIESVAGDDDRDDLSFTFLQPFLSYVTTTKTTYIINSESTYDWESSEWAVPINLMANQMIKVGPQIMQIGVGARYWADSPEGAAEDWGARLQVIFLFPK